MELGFSFFFTSIMLGVGLAMDAFSVSLANGLNEPCMKRRKMCGVAGLFAFFQALMPLLGWVCAHTIAQYSEKFESCLPWITMALLGFIGGKMLYEGITTKCGGENEEPCKDVGVTSLIVQGIATSIDALSAGVENAYYNFAEMLLSAVLIAAITFVICLGGILIGRKGGACLAGKASILGGAILIFIGLKSFIIP